MSRGTSENKSCGCAGRGEEREGHGTERESKRRNSRKRLSDPCHGGVCWGAAASFCLVPSLEERVRSSKGKDSNGWWFSTNLSLSLSLSFSLFLIASRRPLKFVAANVTRRRDKMRLDSPSFSGIFCSFYWPRGRETEAGECRQYAFFRISY